jgi:hypothetical protein
MANGKIAGARRVSVKEVRELLKLAWVREEELCARDLDARVLPDGRVLLYWGEGERGTLYPSGSAEELKRSYDETLRKALQGPVDMTRTLLPPVADFLRDVEAHAKSLGKRIGVADEALDGTPQSLDAVDKALKKIPWAKRQVPDLVTPLVAYVGEVMRKASGGRWMPSPKPGKNEPVVIGRDGRLCKPYSVVFLPMVEPSRRIPLRSAVDIQLRVGPPPPAA